MSSPCCPRHVEPTLRPGSCYSAAFHFSEPCCDDCPDFVRADPEPELLPAPSGAERTTP